jgi:hypothetical protein
MALQLLRQLLLGLVQSVTPCPLASPPLCTVTPCRHACSCGHVDFEEQVTSTATPSPSGDDSSTSTSSSETSLLVCSSHWFNIYMEAFESLVLSKRSLLIIFSLPTNKLPHPRRLHPSFLSSQPLAKSIRSPLHRQHLQIRKLG